MSQPSERVSAPRRASLDALLHYAWDAESFTAGEAMPAVGLTRSTTIDALDELVERALIRELPNAREVGDYSKGRPARRFEFCADAGVVVGLDAGRAHVTTTIADLRGAVLAREHLMLDDDSISRRRAVMATAVDDALGVAGLERGDVIALCAGVPAPVDSEGVSPTHHDGFWQRMNPDLIDMFRAWVPLVRVENDASLAAVAEGSLSPEEVDEETLARHLATDGIPDPDLLVRTGAEMRISNFLLWQLAYAELYFSDRLWPDYGEDDLRAAIAEFQRRERRFGTVRIPA